MHGTAEILVPKTTYCNTGAVNRIHGTADILVPKTTYGNTGATSCMCSAESAQIIAGDTRTHPSMTCKTQGGRTGWCSRLNYRAELVRFPARMAPAVEPRHLLLP